MRGKALYFHKSQTEKLVIVLRADDSSFGMGENKVTLEVMAADKEKSGSLHGRHSTQN